MNCSELDALLCDYVEGTLSVEQKKEVERHLAICATCAETARDAAAAVAFIERVPAVEPPPELVTRILFELGAQQGGMRRPRRGFRAMLGRLLQPVLQPRFAMGMAMTILSFSMLARLGGINVRQLRMSDLDPVKVWETVDDRIQRTWSRAVKFYENLRLVYEVRSRLNELTAQDEKSGARETRPPGSPEKRATPQSGGPVEKDPSP